MIKATKQYVTRAQAAHNALTIAGGQQGKTLVFSDRGQVLVIVSPEYVKEKWLGGKGPYPDQFHMVVGAKVLDESEVLEMVKEQNEN